MCACVFIERENRETEPIGSMTNTHIGDTDVSYVLYLYIIYKSYIYISYIWGIYVIYV